MMINEVKRSEDLLGGIQPCCDVGRLLEDQISPIIFLSSAFVQHISKIMGQSRNQAFVCHGKFINTVAHDDSRYQATPNRTAVTRYD
jgi:hypothetical protein